MSKQAIELSDTDVDACFSSFDLQKEGKISRKDWEDIFGQMYDQHLLQGLQDAFTDYFPG